MLDGYRSYITANVIVYYIENKIDLLVLLPYCSYVLQLLDISIFILLKRALAIKMDSVARLDPSYIVRIEWI